MNVPKLGMNRVCVTGKLTYASGSDALAALARVREDRLKQDRTSPPECRTYPCPECHGWHLTSQSLRQEDLVPPLDRQPAESWEAYAKRLERRVGEQRAHIASMLLVGGGSNRKERKRVATLVVALGRMTERWEQERRDRIALVLKLRQRRPWPFRVFSTTSISDTSQKEGL